MASLRSKSLLISNTLLILFVFPSIAHSDYRERFYDQMDQKDFSGMEKDLGRLESLPIPTTWNCWWPTGIIFMLKGLTGADEQRLHASPFPIGKALFS